MPSKRKPTRVKPRPAPAQPAERLDLEALAAAQGVRPIGSPEELAADFWPAVETAYQFVAAVRRWRREGGARGEAG